MQHNENCNDFKHNFLKSKTCKVIRFMSQCAIEIKHGAKCNIDIDESYLRNINLPKT